MSRLHNRSLQPLFCAVLVSALAMAACEVPAASSARFLGDWKLVAGDSLDRASLKLLPSGSCSFKDQTEEFHYCRWATGHDETVVIRYGLFLPLNTASAKVTGDEMSLDFGNHFTWSLVRAGSQKEQDAAAYLRGDALVDSGSYEKGMAEWAPAAEHGHPGAQNGLAWVLATSKSPELRDGKKAVAYAEKATATLHHFLYLDTLAAALARDQQFERAVKVEEEALSLLEKDESWPDREAALTRFKNRLALYKAGQPYTEP